MICRACNKLLPKPFLDLGTTPLANSYLHAGEWAEEKAYPLAVCYCRHCHLVQLQDTVPPETMFSDYAYESSHSTTFLAHAKKMANEIMHEFFNTKGTVLEIGSNDGYLLQYLKEQKYTVLGVDPAKNIAEKANANGIPTLNEFFNLDTVHTILNVYSHFNVIVGNNVLAHVPDIKPFLQAVKECLTEHGTAIFEVPYLPMMIEKKEFDTIYHEHVFYFSVIALRSLFARSGLEIFDIKYDNIHGGSIRIYAGHEGRGPVSSTVSQYECHERLLGFDTPMKYELFEYDATNIMDSLRENLRCFKEKRNTIAAYGAPAKGNTLLNTAMVGKSLIDFTVDRNPNKQGLLLPGSRIPILKPEELVKRMPDYCVILPWNFKEEIMEQQAEYLNRGGKFIIPIPEWEVIGE